MKLHCITLLIFVFFLGAYIEQERADRAAPVESSERGDS